MKVDATCRYPELRLISTNPSLYYTGRRKDWSQPSRPEGEQSKTRAGLASASKRKHAEEVLPQEGTPVKWRKLSDIQDSDVEQALFQDRQLFQAQQQLESASVPWGIEMCEAPLPDADVDAAAAVALNQSKNGGRDGTEGSGPPSGGSEAAAGQSKNAGRGGAPGSGPPRLRGSVSAADGWSKSSGRSKSGSRGGAPGSGRPVGASPLAKLPAAVRKRVAPVPRPSGHSGGDWRAERLMPRSDAQGEIEGTPAVGMYEVAEDRTIGRIPHTWIPDLGPLPSQVRRRMVECPARPGVTMMLAFDAAKVSPSTRKVL